MKKIDRETVQRILDTADIVEVVSDFVNLKRRGSSYLGLCPFHNERTPSFSVSKTKNICKCFSCGKGGSPVNFIMELEQMNYYEALRYLARKYNIEIKEHEMTSEEKEKESERESLFAVNDFALKHFERNLTETDDGRDIGLSYFLDRGLTEASIRKFRLGYAMEKSNSLYNEAVAAGYQEKYLIDTGVCIKTDSGRLYDRFKGRVIFPVFSVSGKVVAFGGRTLKKDVAKYVNSPESAIYHKSNQLYGLYQAKPAIVKADKCILVEGYMDVISMSQSGIENVVASSGTSLTEGQIRLIHRFTNNVTVIYDGDAAGIKASLRGIDMLLAEGLNIKVLLLPDGDDPDSFAQSHTSSQLEEYIKANEVDFIRFKTSILLQGVENDPISKSKVVGDIVQSISVIPEPLTRNVYAKECSRALEVDERVIVLEVEKRVKALSEKNLKKVNTDSGNNTVEKPQPDGVAQSPAAVREDAVVLPTSDTATFLRPYEKKILQYALRYGLLYICDIYDENDQQKPMTVLEYIDYEFVQESLRWTNPDIETIMNEIKSVVSERWANDYARADERFLAERAAFISEGEEKIRQEEIGLDNIKQRESMLLSRADDIYYDAHRQYASSYIEKIFTSHPDDNIRSLSEELVSERHILSKVHTKYAKIETDEDRLADLVPRSIYEYIDARLECSIKSAMYRLRAASVDPACDQNSIRTLMEEIVGLQASRGELAKLLGERIINPRK